MIEEKRRFMTTIAKREEKLDWPNPKKGVFIEKNYEAQF